MIAHFYFSRASFLFVCRANRYRHYVKRTIRAFDVKYVGKGMSNMLRIFDIRLLDISPHTQKFEDT